MRKRKRSGSGEKRKKAFSASGSRGKGKAKEDLFPRNRKAIRFTCMGEKKGERGQSHQGKKKGKVFPSVTKG